MAPGFGLGNAMRQLDRQRAGRPESRRRRGRHDMRHGMVDGRRRGVTKRRLKRRIDPGWRHRLRAALDEGGRFAHRRDGWRLEVGCARNVRFLRTPARLHGRLRALERPRQPRLQHGQQRTLAKRQCMQEARHVGAPISSR
jgi:hypothetical protein